LNLRKAKFSPLFYCERRGGQRLSHKDDEEKEINQRTAKPSRFDSSPPVKGRRCEFLCFLD
jgi:hypothetical protein